MKTPTILISFLALIPAALPASTVVEQWDFTDGTSLTTTSNGGTWLTAWGGDLDATSISGGNYVVGGLPASQTSVNATLTSPITGSGKYLFEVTFSGWDFASGDGVDTTGIWNFGIGVLEGANFLGRALLRYDGNPDLRAATYTTGGTRLVSVASDLGLASSTTRTVGIEFDFDANTVRYLVNGAETHSYTDFIGTSITGFSISRFGGTGTWDDADASISIDSIKLTSLTVAPPPTEILVDFTSAEGYSDGTLNGQVSGAWSVANPVVWNVADSAGAGLLTITPNGTFQKVTYAGPGAAFSSNTYSSANVFLLDYSADTLGANLTPGANTMLARFEFQGGGVTGSWLRQMADGPGLFSLYLFSDLNTPSPQLGGITLEATDIGLAHDGTNWTDAVSDPLQLVHYMVYDALSATWTQIAILTNLATSKVLDVLEQTYAEDDNSFLNTTNSFVINNGRLLDLANLTLKVDSVSMSTVAQLPDGIVITGTAVTAGNEFVIDFTGAPSANYQVLKSTNLVDFSSMAAAVSVTTNGSGVGQAVVPASEMADPKQFFRLVYAP